MHLGVLEYPRYLVNLTFSGLELVDKHFKIEDIVFTISTYRLDNHFNIFGIREEKMRFIYKIYFTPWAND